MAEQTMLSKPLVSIITPCYNEQENLTPFYEAVTATMKPLPYDYEVVFVDDGSEDGTTGQIEQLAERDPHVRPVELVRNFGKEVAMSAGLASRRPPLRRTRAASSLPAKPMTPAAARAQRWVRSCGWMNRSIVS